MTKENLTAAAEMEQSSQDTLSGAPALELNFARYMPLIEDIHISDEEKHEFLKNLASILSMFVEMGIGVKNCEQLFQDSNQIPSGIRGGVKSDFSSAAKDAENAEGSPRHDR